MLTVILISSRFCFFRLLSSQDRELSRKLDSPTCNFLQLVVKMENRTSVECLGCNPVRVLNMRTKVLDLLRDCSIDSRAMGHSGTGLRELKGN